MKKDKSQGVAKTSANTKGAHRVFIQMKKHWQIYVLILPAVIWYLVFAYYPMAGLQLAFKSYRVHDGIFGSPFIGFKNFEALFRDMSFWKSILRTLKINLLRMVIVFPAPIILALMISELRVGKYKNIMQTILTFPNFLSWVIVASIMINLLSIDGLANNFLEPLTGKRVNFIGSESMFQPMLYITDIWKNAGYSAIIYLSAIMGIDQDQYEAAEIDGANRMQRLLHITIPNLMPTVSIMFIMMTGSILSAGFDQVFNLSNAATKNVAEILDMYIYRITFEGAVDFGFSTAVSLFRSVVNMALLIVANKGSKMLGGSGLFG